jgi:hypothetical protein
MLVALMREPLQIGREDVIAAHARELAHEFANRR